MSDCGDDEYATGVEMHPHDNGGTSRDDLSNSNSHSQTTTLPSNNRGDDGSQGDSSFGVRETKQLRRFRLYLTGALFLVAGAIASGTYVLVHRQERAEFHDSYDDSSVKLVDSVHAIVERKIGSLESLSFSVTSYAKFRNLTWPFVTIPDFEYKAASVRALSQAVSIELCPLVKLEDRAAWEDYAKETRDKWIDAGLDFEELVEAGFFDEVVDTSNRPDRRELQDEMLDNITFINDNDERLPVLPNTEYMFPVWQSSPVSKSLINLDLHSNKLFSDNIDLLIETGEVIVGKTVDTHGAEGTGSSLLQAYDDSLSTRNEVGFYETDGPVDFLYVPVFDVLNSDDRAPVAVLTTVLYWESYMFEALPPHTPEVRVVVTNACGEAFTYAVLGEFVEFVGIGDLHDPKFDSFKVDDITFNFENLASSLERYHGVPVNDACQYHMEIYPTQEYEDKYLTNKPWIFFAMALAIFSFLIGMIFFYDRRVEKNYQTIYKRAKQAGAIVSSIFPAAVRQRLYQDEERSRNSQGANNPNSGMGADGVPMAVNATKNRIKGFLTDPGADTTVQRHNSMPAESTLEEMEGSMRVVAAAKGRDSSDKAIADLFPDVTIIFADVVGFTAWSSQRDPGEVFTFLQNLYQEFDTAARTMGVFKVETIGDCYVAATGLPEPQADHAVRMAKFAAKCMISMVEVTRDLEVRLGPDTGELRMRTGLHSGPVTAGVLKGAKARFQLFGDTMNMAARMEHNSKPGRIQCSEYTAGLIRDAGKGHWLQARDELVSAKGKGDVQTYWLTPKMASGSMFPGDNGEEASAHPSLADRNIFGDNVDRDLLANAQLVFDLGTPNNRYHRLIDWNVELLSDLLKQIEARRRDAKKYSKYKGKSLPTPKMELQGGSTALDEVTEIVALPQVEVQTKKRTRASDVELSPEVVSQLRDYVTTIASMYRPNAFHNFEHASHVTMSTNKLLKRVTVTDTRGDGDTSNPANLHDYTFGITSDPLTQFTLVFCALIHDVDHSGVSNYQLIQEKATIAQLYRNKSVAEQNSVDLSWDLLMDPRYRDMQKAIYADEDELKRFRQLMVNIVLATDIFDKDMKSVRDRRWGRAFQYANDDEEEEQKQNLPIRALERDYDTPLSRVEGANLKATIVMEHLIQASDVAHTMQHWEIYLKWNERLFNEMYCAYEDGRAMKDPSSSWYEGEIMFFDKYVIPLAKKLDDCRVFGVSSDECLNYANQNRKQWAIRGDEIIKEFLARYHERKAAAADSCVLRVPGQLEPVV
eukprot:CAMPEP_0117000886 /NCGR_PEP_ID=MMETSP0472-20121206/3077_1 /TAXON_ID=693140 ORGANISM="Tiarina fusus, Strain LIS" /NCGR_SAMPLE_ID=MMETSP0472 /ASSEMBLY_ACC=CAM_ASM_000603 /LENGTH=1264 /DNA_ID=CAMNT_0004700725 /DNA_START=238 /DNA_END=4032 /DNA_ORIENTATION=+